MTRIPVMVMVIDEVVPDASFEREFTSKVISTCFNCGSIVFYKVVEYNYEDSEHAVDTCTYCAVCGQMQVGYTSDPFDELESLKVGAEWWRNLDWNIAPKVWEQLPTILKKKIEAAGLAPKTGYDKMRQCVEFNLEPLRVAVEETGFGVRYAIFTPEENTLTITFEDGSKITIQAWQEVEDK